jgi:hypothetical protein
MTELERAHVINADALAHAAASAGGEFGKKCVGEEGYLLGEMLSLYLHPLINSVYGAGHNNEDALNAAVLVLKGADIEIPDHITRDIKAFHDTYCQKKVKA